MLYCSRLWMGAKLSSAIACPVGQIDRFIMICIIIHIYEKLQSTAQQPLGRQYWCTVSTALFVVNREGVMCPGVHCVCSGGDTTVDGGCHRDHIPSGHPGRAVSRYFGLWACHWFMCHTHRLGLSVWPFGFIPIFNWRTAVFALTFFFFFKYLAFASSQHLITVQRRWEYIAIIIRVTLKSDFVVLFNCFFTSDSR